MMATPVYLVSALIGLGYYLNKDGRKERIQIKRKKVSKHHVPNNDEIYNSNNVSKARKQEQDRADDNWRKSKDPINTNIIPPLFNTRDSERPRKPKKLRKKRLGESTKALAVKLKKGAKISMKDEKLIQKERDLIPLAKVQDTQGWKPIIEQDDHYMSKRPGFFHNNMEPFFGGSIKQNMKADLHRTRLEHFTGAEPSYKHKKEVKRLFAPEKQNIHGQQAQADRQLERYYVSNKKPGEKPFEQIKVQPGVGLKPGQKAKHGFHDSYRPRYKTVDELRIKPKISYKGRIVKGLKSVKRGKQAKVLSRRPKRYSEQKQGGLVRQTMGGMSKPRKRERFTSKATARSQTSIEYSGNAKANVSKQQMASKRRISNKPSYKYPKGIVKGKDRSYIKGKTRTPAKAQFCIPVGNTKPQEERSYSYDPNDIARTTMKETIVGRNVTGGIGGQVNKLTAYDSEDIARTTGKQTLIDNDNLGIAAPGIDKFTVYDPNDLARTTIKETLVGKNITANYNGQVGKQTVYDPEDIARRTGKETLADKNVTGLYSGMGKHIVYDSEERAKETIREQTENTQRQSGNVEGRGRNVNPYIDKAKTTMRQTTQLGKKGGNIRGKGRNVNPYTDKAKTTIRQSTQVGKKGGNIRGKGRHVNPHTDRARRTIKESTMTKNYMGVTNGDAKQTSRQNMYNAEINALRELVLKNRNPTQSGPKNALGAVAINMESIAIPLNPKWVIGKNITNGCRRVPRATQIKQPYCNTGTSRINPKLLSAFKKNPYTQSLTSAPVLNV